MFYNLEKMDIDLEVIKIMPETAIITSHNTNQVIDTKIHEVDNLIILDTESSSSSSEDNDDDDDDVLLVNHYKLDDMRPVIGEYSKCSDCEIIYLVILSFEKMFSLIE